jgi:hypothetical protein
MGGGWLGTGTYASLIDPSGSQGQMIYSSRAGRALLELSMQKPLILVQGKNFRGDQENAINDAIWATAGIKAPSETKDPWSYKADQATRRELKNAGYDGIVLIKQERNPGDSLGSQVVVFDAGSQIKIIDSDLDDTEWMRVRETGQRAPVVKAESVASRFDGDGFDLVDLADLFDPSIAKAYKRKYGSRTEAARAAANARWGNRSTYNQQAQVSPRSQPVAVEMLYPWEVRQDKDFVPATIIDTVITESVEPFDEDAFVKMAEMGPVSLVGVHATERRTPDLPFTGEPQGGGVLGQGVYASLVNRWGMYAQENLYQDRGRQALVRLEMNKPMVVTNAVEKATRQKLTEIDGGYTFGNILNQAVFAHLMSNESDPKALLQKYEAIKTKESRGSWDTRPESPVAYLKSQGFDGIVYTAERSGQVSVFSSEQIRAIDPVLSADERKLVYETGNKVTKAVGHAFDGRDFQLVSIEELENPSIAKAYKRKYGSRTEAARAAANVRWGNRTKAVPSIDAASLSRGQKITIDGKQLGNLTVNMVDTGLDGDLRNVSIPGYALFDGANMGLRREQMPQMPARNKPKFLSEMRLQGVGVAAQSVDPRTLKPSQADISAAKTGEILKKMRDGSFYDSPAGRILVSKDGFVIDGHHRWAAAAAYAFDVPGARLPIIRVGLNAADLIPAARQFGAREGIKTLGFGETLKKAARWLFGS